MLFSRFHAGLVLALGTGEDLHGLVCLKLGSRVPCVFRAPFVIRKGNISKNGQEPLLISVKAAKKLQLNRQGSKCVKEGGCKSQEEELNEEAGWRGAKICVLVQSSLCCRRLQLTKAPQLGKRRKKQMDKE